MDTFLLVVGVLLTFAFVFWGFQIRMQRKEARELMGNMQPVNVAMEHFEVNAMREKVKALGEENLRLQARIAILQQGKENHEG